VRLTGAERRQEILVAAQSVFTANGLGGARTSQIAEAAGVAESMLYKHFASKRDLFEAAVTKPVAEFVQSVADSADGLLDRDGPGSEHFYRSFMDTMTEVLPLLGVALFSDAEEGRRFYNTSIVPLFDRYEEKVRRSLDAAGGRVDAGFLSRAVIGIMFLLALDTTYRDGSNAGGYPADRAALADEVRSFVYGGLSGAGRREREARTGERIRDLERENATLRRILADQAIEIRTLKDGLEAQDRAGLTTSSGRPAPGTCE
jgi:AcrR family transcriptional regulator